MSAGVALFARIRSFEGYSGRWAASQKGMRGSVSDNGDECFSGAGPLTCERGIPTAGCDVALPLVGSWSAHRRGAVFLFYVVMDTGCLDSCSSWGGSSVIYARDTHESNTTTKT